jgi:hypothetical protein
MEAIRGLPHGVEPVQRTTPKDAIDRMLEEDRKFSARIKLTWNPDKPPGVPDDKMVGEVNLYLPYAYIRRMYYIQNARIYRSNGEPTNMEFVRLHGEGTCGLCLADGESWRRLPKGEVCCVYAEVANAMDVFMRDAMSRDPLLCKVPSCGYVAKGVDAYADHKLWHATEAAKKVDEPVAKVVEAPVEFFVADLSCCGQEFKNEHGLKIHKSRKHKVA